MTAIVLRGLAARKLRTALTALAIVLGAAMVTGTLVMGHTVRSGFHEWYTKANGNSAAVITGHLTVRDNNSDVGTATPPLPASLVAKVRNVPGVAHAEGLVQGEGILIDRSGNEIGGNGPPALVSSALHDPELTPLRLVSGRMPTGAHEIAVDTWSATQAKTAIGGTIRLATERPTHTYKVVGLIRFDHLGTDGATFSIVTAKTAREILGRTGQVDRIQIAADKGVSPSRLVENLKAAGLHAPVKLDIQTAAADGKASEDRDGAFLNVFEYILLAFGGVALLVGAFVIFNTFSITVAQRTRELALLRTLGAGRRQVLSSVVLEAAVIGVTASAIGVATGVGVAAGLFALFAAVGATLPKVGLVVDSGTLVPGLVLGIVVTLVASIVPAIRATRISPTTALREGAGAERKPGKGSLIASFVLLGIAAAALGYGVLGNPSSANTRLLLIAIGSLALILGTAASASRLVGPIVHDRRSAAAALRRPARHARERERAPEPRPHRHHLGGAHDRRRGGRLHRDHRPCRHEREQRRADEARHRRVRRAGERGGRAARQRARRAREGCPGRLERHGHLARGDQGQRRTGPPGLRRRSLDAALGLQVHVEARLGRARLAARRTRRADARRRSRRTSTSPSARRSRSRRRPARRRGSVCAARTTTSSTCGAT